MKSGVETRRQDLERERVFVSEVFHNLSQPLTALQCSLELSLLRDQSAEALRKSIEAALENAAALRQRLMLVRGLNDAGDPGDTSQPVNLGEMLGELREEMLPLFESAGQKFELECAADGMLVRGNRSKLMRGLFYFLEYLLRYSAPGAILKIRAYPSGMPEVVIQIATSSCLPVSPSDDSVPNSDCACEVEILRRSFRAVGGDLASLSSVAGQSVWQGSLPLAPWLPQS